MKDVNVSGSKAVRSYPDDIGRLVRLCGFFATIMKKAGAPIPDDTLKLYRRVGFVLESLPPSIRQEFLSFIRETADVSIPLDIGVELERYTDPNHPEFDPEFNKKIRELRPDWFSK
jgi:hypothetical protein